MHTHTHTHAGAPVWFFSETSLPFCFILPEWISSLAWYFPNTHVVLVVTFSTLYDTWTRCLSSMLFTRNFQWGNTCVQVTLEIRCISCYATHRTYVAFPLGVCVLFTFGNRCISFFATRATFAASQRNIPVDIQKFEGLTLTTKSTFIV